MFVNHAAVWGKPIRHSLSPVLHQAAYRALGLTDWSYATREVDDEGFAAAFAGLDHSWRGLSLTMPLKEVALAAASRVTEVARRTEVANTLVHDSEGWTAHNTDPDGIKAALAGESEATFSRALIIGSGATARSAVWALAHAGTRQLTFMVRARARPETVALARDLGCEVSVVALGDWPQVDAIVSTVPPSSVLGLADLPASTATDSPILDVVYGQGITPLEQAGQHAGWRIVPGTDMLLHQAAVQVQLMTGHSAPLAAMSAALDAALRDRADRTRL